MESCGEEKTEGLIDMNNVQRMFDQEAAIFWVRDSMNQCSSSVLGFSTYDCSMGYWFLDQGELPCLRGTVTSEPFTDSGTFNTVHQKTKMTGVFFLGAHGPRIRSLDRLERII